MNINKICLNGEIGSNKKICVFRVTLPYLIFLVKPHNFMFSPKKKKKKVGGALIKYLC